MSSSRRGRDARRAGCWPHQAFAPKLPFDAKEAMIRTLLLLCAGAISISKRHLGHGCSVDCDSRSSVTSPHQVVGDPYHPVLVPTRRSKLLPLDKYLEITLRHAYPRWIFFFRILLPCCPALYWTELCVLRHAIQLLCGSKPYRFVSSPQLSWCQALYCTNSILSLSPGLSSRRDTR